jgi:hypothetical protein
MKKPKLSEEEKKIYNNIIVFGTKEERFNS